MTLNVPIAMESRSVPGALQGVADACLCREMDDHIGLGGLNGPLDRRGILKHGFRGREALVLMSIVWRRSFSETS